MAKAIKAASKAVTKTVKPKVSKELLPPGMRLISSNELMILNSTIENNKVLINSLNQGLIQHQEQIDIHVESISRMSAELLTTKGLLEAAKDTVDSKSHLIAELRETIKLMDAESQKIVNKLRGSVDFMKHLKDGIKTNRGYKVVKESSLQLSRTIFPREDCVRLQYFANKQTEFELGLMALHLRVSPDELTRQLVWSLKSAYASVFEKPFFS